MRAGIIIDDWKLAIFRKRLTEAGYHYTDGGAPQPNITKLVVVTDDPLALQKVIEAATAECARMKR